MRFLSPTPVMRRHIWSYLAVGLAGLVVGSAVTMRVVDGGTKPTPVAEVHSDSAAATPLPLGQPASVDDLTLTVLTYRQPVDARNTGVDAGTTFGGVEVSTCLAATADAAMEASVDPWSLRWADGLDVSEKWAGLMQGAFPLDAKTILPGRCIKGWIVFHIPDRENPAMVVYESDANRGRPVEWAVS